MKKMLCAVAALWLLAACGGAGVTVSRTLNEEAEIFPDYRDVTIPPNIAPLNFQTDLRAKTCLQVEGEDTSFYVQAEDGLFVIPEKKWKSLLAHNRGRDIRLTVCRQEDSGEWVAYRPFSMHVAEEDIDPYMAYRLVQPGYTYWNRMGIYQRNLETYEQEAVYENNLTDYNCVNCHSFPAGNPEKMLFHMRAKNAGTVLLRGSRVEKSNTKTPETLSALVYPYWHPSGNYVALTVNDTRQAFFANQSGDVLEVFDNESDVMIYDLDRQEIFSSPLLRSTGSLETYPVFSPDGKSLYFCSAEAVDNLPMTYKEVKYSLLRIDIDVENRTFGTQVDTLFNAKVEGRSLSFPRISPDGRYMAVTLHGFGCFPIWHHDADLYLIDLTDGSMKPLEEVNSDTATDSYHSWSGNGRWMVFSSRRLDGLYTRPYFTYIDKEGRAHKPFLLPQKNPAEYYESLFFSYNIPELIAGKIEVNPQHIATAMKETEGTDVRYASK